MGTYADVSPGLKRCLNRAAGKSRGLSLNGSHYWSGRDYRPARQEAIVQVEAGSFAARQALQRVLDHQLAHATEGANLIRAALVEIDKIAEAGRALREIYP